MEEKIIGVIKQPAEAAQKRGIIFLIISMFLLIYMIFKNEEFMNLLQKSGFILILPVICIVFFIIGIYMIAIVYLNRDLKEIKIRAVNDKLYINGQLPFTPVFTDSKVIEMNYPLKEAKLVTGNLKGSIIKWWKLILNDGNTTSAVTIVKSNLKNAADIVNELNK
jgi:hypothetical protein